FAGLSGRVGGQLGQALAYNRVPGHTDPNSSQLAVSALGEAYIQQALAREQQLETAGAADALSRRIAQFADAQQRGAKLARLAASLPQNSNNGAALATSIGQAFRQGLTTSVTVNQVGGFDTHSDNTQQNNSYMNLFTFLNAFVGGLASQPGLIAPS